MSIKENEKKMGTGKEWLVKWEWDRNRRERDVERQGEMWGRMVPKCSITQKPVK